MTASPRFTRSVLTLALLMPLAALAAPAASTAEGLLQTKTPYAPQQAIAAYAPVPAGFQPVYTGLVARHGSRGLSGMKYDLAAYRMWLQARQQGALTPLGRRLGDDVLALMKANALLGHGVPGISTPGYGNESRRGIEEHRQLAQRMLQRLPGYWPQVAATPGRELVVVSSGKDRAVDSAHFFVEGLRSANPALATRVVRPAAPAPYPDTGTAVAQPDGVDRFTLYFHNLNAKTDGVSRADDPRRSTYEASQAYQQYTDSPALAASQQALLRSPAIEAASRAALLRLFSPAFVDGIASGKLQFANTGSMRFCSRDQRFCPTLTGDGEKRIDSLGSAAATLYELYAIAPALDAEAGVDFTPYLDDTAAATFAELNDALDFEEKGPAQVGPGGVTSAMAQLLVDDLFGEVDAIARGDLRHAAKLRFTHAEIMIPLATALGLPGMSEPADPATGYHYDSSAWRGARVSPMAANLQWDVFANAQGRLLVRMLYNEREMPFKAACDGARVDGAPTFYDYAALKACYGHVPQA